MANSLRAKISKLRHDRNITEEEYQELISKLDGHDKQIRTEAIEEFAEWFDKEYVVYQKYYGGICKVKIATTIRRYELKEQNGKS